MVKILVTYPYQASRRSYRLIQKETCRTFYMAYKNTAQEKVIEIMAEKLVATSAIQGKFSAEGLAAMSNGVDARVKLAQALADKDYQGDDKSIKNMFEKINQTNAMDEEDYGSLVGNIILSELLGNELVIEKVNEDINNDVLINVFDFDLFSFKLIQITIYII
jgi:predicted phage tail protein